MVLSLFAGQVAGTTTILGFTDETFRSNNLIGGVGAGMTTISVIGINLVTDTADTLVSVRVELTSVTNFDNTDIFTVDLYVDSPGGVNGVWDPTDTNAASGVWDPPAPPVYATVITPGAPLSIPVDDDWENQGNDYFIVVASSATIGDGDQFTAGIPNSGITTTNEGGLPGSTTTATVTCDAVVPDLQFGAADILGVSSDSPIYFDDEDTFNNIGGDPNPGVDWVYYNDYPGEGSDQVTTITIQNFVENNPHSFYGAATYFNENPVDNTLSVGAYSLDYKLTWTESDINPASGFNSGTLMSLIVEDEVGYTSTYMGGNLLYFQDDDPPLSRVNFDNAGTGLWYYDESLMGNYLPYVDENNQIWVEATDDWWTLWDGSGFDKGSS